MKKLLAITGIIIFILFGISCFNTAKTPEISINAENIPINKNISESAISNSHYLLTTENGVIVVKDSQNSVVKITDTPISILPQQDKIRLKKGIKVKNQKQLIKLLEDYCS